MYATQQSFLRKGIFLYDPLPFVFNKIRFLKIELYRILKFVAISIFFLFASLSSFKLSAQDKWIRKNDFSGGYRLMATSFVIGNKAYVAMGSGAKSYRDLWEYDASMDKWTKKADYPGKAFERGVSFSVGGKGYVGMGDSTGYNGFKFFKDFYEYDPVKDSWAKKADYPGDAAASAVGFAIDSMGYVGTGWDANSVKNEFYQYNPVSDVWTKKANAGGGARGFATGFSIGKKGYLGTGFTYAGANSIRLKDFWEYDATKDKWTQKADINEYGVYDASSFVIGNRGYVGMGTDQMSTYVFYEFNPMENKWTQRADVGDRLINDSGVGFSLSGKGYMGLGHFLDKKMYEYTPCPEQNLNPDFEIVQDNYKINLSQKNTGPFKYRWDFGDGKSDTSASVMHTFATVGSYKVKLVISGNCRVETMEKTVRVVGFEKIVNNRAGNSGVFTAMLIGSGIKKFSIKNGATEILGSALREQNDGSTVLQLNLDKQPLGLYDAVAVFNDNSSLTLKDAFTVEGRTPAKLTVALTGENVLRVGFKQIYSINYTNSGNTDAKSVPIYVGGLPPGTNIDIKGKLFPLETVPGFGIEGFESAKNQHTITNQNSNTTERSIILPRIPANSSGSTEVVFELPPDAQLHSQTNVNTVIGEPNQVDDPVAQKAWDECEKSIREKIVETALDKVLSDPYDPFKFKDCISGIGSTVDKAKAYNENALKYVNEDLTYYLDRADLIASGTNTLISCARSAASVAELAGFVTINPALNRVGAILDAELMLAQKVSGLSAEAAEIAKLVNDCQKEHAPQDQSSTPLVIGNAWDPNALYGPGDLSADHHTNQRMLNYTVSFENLPTANLNAQTVVVRDTLRGSSLDFSSFAFTSVRLGDLNFKLTVPHQSFIHDFDLTAKYGVKARVVASFDAQLGIATWKLYTIDPVTNQPTGKALSGFLPPNKNSPEGEGYLGYRIALKEGVGSGSKINNQAFITFDFNPVIPTNTWDNTTDFEKPTSLVEALPAVSADSVFVVKWSGKDNLSGIRSYNVYYSINNGYFRQLINNTHDTNISFQGKKDSTYRFYALAWDNAGNFEGDKSAHEAVTRVGNPKAQLITFPDISQKIYGDSDFDPMAISSAGLTVIYSSSDNSIAEVVGNKIKIKGTGTVKITVSQQGNDVFAAAKSMERTFTVIRADQLISFPEIMVKKIGDADFEPGATSNSSLGITYVSSNPAVAVMVGSKIHLLSAGTTVITASQTGNTNYNAALTVSRTLLIQLNLLSSNFRVSTLSAGCKGRNTGGIEISASAALKYSAVLSGNGHNETVDFTSSHSFTGLAAGAYKVCITVQGQTGFSQCYDLNVTEPKDLSVYMSVDKLKGALSLQMSGGDAYNISINGKAYRTNQQSASLPLIIGSNKISVTSDLLCQGKVEQIINISGKGMPYPNPFTDILFLNLGDDLVGLAEVKVFGLIDGKLKTIKNFYNTSGVVQMNMGGFDSGIYSLQLNQDGIKTIFKIIKK